MTKENPAILRFLSKLSHIVELMGKFISAIAGFVMLFSLLTGVFTRYLPFMTTAIWSEEIARMMMLWITTTGASVAFSRKELVKLDLVIGALPDKPRKIMNIINDVFVLIVLGILLYYGYGMLLLKAKVTVAATHMSYFWWALGFYIGFIFMAIHAIRHLVEDILILSGRVIIEEET